MNPATSDPPFTRIETCPPTRARCLFTVHLSDCVYCVVLLHVFGTIPKRTALHKSSNVVLKDEGQDNPNVALEAMQEKLRGAIKVGDGLEVEALVRDMSQEEATIQLVTQDWWDKNHGAGVVGVVLVVWHGEGSVP